MSRNHMVINRIKRVKRIANQRLGCGVGVGGGGFGGGGGGWGGGGRLDKRMAPGPARSANIQISHRGGVWTDKTGESHGGVRQRLE